MAQALQSNNKQQREDWIALAETMSGKEMVRLLPLPINAKRRGGKAFRDQLDNFWRERQPLQGVLNETPLHFIIRLSKVQFDHHELLPSHHCMH